MYEAVLCKEGYLCGLRTTRTAMLTRPCPTGYYTKEGASDLQDAYLCPDRKYCSTGTTATKVTQSDCLPGYYCPLGTAAQLNLDGTFSDEIYQVQRGELIGILKDLIARNKQTLAEFDLADIEYYQYRLGKAIKKEMRNPEELRDMAWI